MDGEQFSRRRLIGAAAIGAVAATPATVLAVKNLSRDDQDAASRGGPVDDADRFRVAESSIVPAYGPHQAGIATLQQEHACFAAFTVRGLRGSPDAGVVRRLRAVLAQWTRGIDRLSRGESLVGATAGLDPARLTVTVGLGPGIFSLPGLEGVRPKHLRELPAFEGDRLDPALCGGDLIVQICADDAHVVGEALRALRRLGGGRVEPRWTQHGFLPRPSNGGTPRNLMGHKDGTSNPRPGTQAFDRAVWATEPGEPSWFHGGTYLVLRRIRMRLPEWNSTPRSQQDMVIGRRRGSGAPLSGGGEFTKPDVERLTEGSHVALAMNTPMLRRGYNYQDGQSGSGGRDVGEAGESGLLFAAYLNDPRRFITLQDTLARFDRLRAFVEHTGSAIVAVPPGATPEALLAEPLLTHL